MLESLVWVGAAVTLGGLVILLWCIIRLFSVRRTITDDAELRDALQKLVPYNLGAVLMSVLGLMLVIVGVFLS